MARYKTSVDSIAVPLYSDISTIPNNSVGVAVITQQDITGEILRTSCNGFAMKMGNYFRYGRDYFTNGLPEGFRVSAAYDLDAVKEVIEAETGREVTIVGHFVDTPEDQWFAEDFVQRNYAWRASDGVLQDPPISSQSGTAVTMDSYSIRDNGDLSIRLRYTYRNSTAYYSVVHKAGLNQQNLYYHIKYVFTDNANNMDPRYWFYDPETGEYPQLDLPDDLNLESPYLPIVPIRKDNIDLTADSKKDTDLWKTSRRLLKKISLDFQGLGEQVNENPSVEGDPDDDQNNGIDHVYVIFGLDIRTERDASNRYLYRYFDDLSGRGLDRVDVKDAGYHIRLEFSDITSREVIGSIGDVGDVTKSFSGNNLTIRYQKDESNYGEVVVYNFWHRNYIYKTHSVDTSLSASGDKDNNNFIVPLNYSLAEEEKSIQQREELYQEAVNLVFNAYDRRKLEWYETAWFQGIVFVASIALSIWSAGSSLALLGGIVTAYGLTSAIVMGALLAALSYVTSIVFEILADKLGGVWAAVIAVAAMVLARNYTASFFKVDANFPADQLLTLQSNINNLSVSRIQSGIKDAFSSMQQDIYDEMKAMEDEFKLMEDELKDLYDELNSNRYLDPMLFTGANMFVSPNETPDDFYNRTIHAGNIGTASLAVPSEFVDNKLNLPQPEYSDIEE